MYYVIMHVIEGIDGIHIVCVLCIVIRRRDKLKIEFIKRIGRGLRDTCMVVISNKSYIHQVTTRIRMQTVKLSISVEMTAVAP